jgi:hypothetical protein
MASKKKLRGPHFVSAELKNGEVIMVDDDGEVWIVMMHRLHAGPLVLRQLRRVEMQRKTERSEPPSPRPFRLKLIPP